MKFAAPRNLNAPPLCMFSHLKKVVTPGFAVEAVRIHDRRSPRDGPDALGGGANVIDGDGGFWSGGSQVSA